MDPETYRLFSEAAHHNGTVRVNNTYRGVPIQANATVVEMHVNEVIVKANSLQAVCTRFQGFSYLVLDNLTFFARLNFAEIKSETIIFRDISLCKRDYNQRRFVRVSPPALVSAQFTSPRIKPEEPDKPTWVKGSMYDISIHGIALLENAVMFKLAPLFLYDPAVIKLSLLDPVTKKENLITMEGEIRNVVSLNDKFVRLGLETKPDRSSENVLTHYVAQLQKDIIQELKDILEKELLTIDING